MAHTDAFYCAVEAAYAVEGVGEESSTIFQRSCAGCHAGGGNILQPVRLNCFALRGRLPSYDRISIVLWRHGLSITSFILIKQIQIHYRNFSILPSS